MGRKLVISMRVVDDDAGELFSVANSLTCAGEVEVEDVGWLIGFCLRAIDPWVAKLDSEYIMESIEASAPQLEWISRHLSEQIAAESE